MVQARFCNMKAIRRIHGADTLNTVVEIKRETKQMILEHFERCIFLFFSEFLSCFFHLPDPN